MASKYYISKRPQTNNYHSVHKEGCPFLPGNNDSIFLGFLSSGEEAAIEGNKHFAKTSCCRFCMKDQQSEERQAVFHGIDIERIFSSENQLLWSLQSTIVCIMN